MNETDGKKSLGREFLRHLRSKSNDSESFEVAIKEFASDSPENRVAVAMSLLALGADTSEKPFDRNFALAQLGLFTRTCGLRNNKELQQQLSDIIDEWSSELTNETLQTRERSASSSIESQLAPWGALSALGAVNRLVGLEKCDQVIKLYGESEAGRQVRKLRAGIERLNPLES